MLPRQPLRFVLADDPGAGKTIMAGLYIRELIRRADAHRIVIVVPGSLVEQWRDERFEKFGLEFRNYINPAGTGIPQREPLRGQPPVDRPPRSILPERRPPGEALPRRLGPGRVR
jgi:hypothetical protein